MKMVKFISFAVSLACLGGGAAWALTPTNDLETLSKIHSINLFEIQVGKLAQEKGTSADVKAYGQHLVTDHTKAEAKLNSLAESKKLSLNNQASSETDPILEELNKATGDDFQKKFLTAMVKGHSEAINDVKAAEDTTKDKEIKSFYADLIPQLKAHENHAVALNKKYNK